MVIFISGASGFIGSHLIERLVNNGHEIIALTRGVPKLMYAPSARVRWIYKDILTNEIDFDILPNIDVVIHLAGATLGVTNREDLYLYANELTTVRLMMSLVGRTKRFIYASSQAVYGDAQCLDVDENFATRPDNSAYGCSKLNTENWLKWFYARFGGQILIMRFCGFIEGGGLVDYIIDRALLGEEIELYSNGNICRDYLPIENALDALISSIDIPYDSQFMPINIGSGQAISARQLAEIICSTLGSQSRIRFSSKKSPQGDFVFCIDRAKRLLNFQPSNLIAAVVEHAKKMQKIRG